MATERKPLKAPAAPVRRPAAAAVVKKAAPPLSPLRALQQRLGDQRAQALLQRQANSLQRTPTVAVAAKAATTGLTAAAKEKNVVESGIAHPGTSPQPARNESPPPATAKGAPAASSVAATPAPGGQSPASGRAHEAKASVTSSVQKAAPSNENKLAPTIAAIHQRTTLAKRHPQPNVPVASAHAAAITPAIEQQRAAASQTVATIDAVPAQELQRQQFKAKLLLAIEQATPQPKTADEAKSVMSSGAQQANTELRSHLGVERDAATQSLRSAVIGEPASKTPPSAAAASLKLESAGAPPASVPAEGAVPAPLPAAQLDYSADHQATDAALAAGQVTHAQLRACPDPAFTPLHAAHARAAQHETQAAAKYRTGETSIQQDAHAQASQSLAKELGGIHGHRTQKIGSVGTQQLAAQSKATQERQRITSTIVAIKDKTRTAVETKLNSLEIAAGNCFEDGLQKAETAYQKAFDQAKGGFWKWFSTWGDEWKAHVESALKIAREQYMAAVGRAIDAVADLVAERLREAKLLVANGRKEIEQFVNSLEGNLKQYGEEAQQAVAADFEQLVGGIEERRDMLVSSLTQQYKASSQRMSELENQLRTENRTLWDRVCDATLGVVKEINEFRAMLQSALGSAAAVVVDIVLHPVRFLTNLVNGIGLGLKNFVGNIGTHLQKGLIGWVFGALSGAGLELPEKFDLDGIIKLVLQIVGLTYANFRARAVKIVGERTVSALEKTAEVFLILAKEGAVGLWRFIKTQLTMLKTLVWDGIIGFIRERVIIAGITWILSLLNPASAFFKACKAIFDIVMFFINRGAQVLALVQAVVGSMASIAKGAIGAAASYVESALARSIPVAIGFLASLLGLGDPTKPVRQFLDKAQAPVNKAIDWVIGMAVKGVKKVAQGLGLTKGTKDDNVSSNSSDKDVHSIAIDRLLELVGSENSVDKIEQAILTVRNDMRPLGLKTMEIVEGKDDSIFMILIEASPKKIAAKLVPKAKKKSISVAMTVRIRLSGSQDLLEGNTAQNSTFSKVQHDDARVNDDQEFTHLTPDPISRFKIPTKNERQYRSSGAAIRKPQSGETELMVVAWNTGDRLAGSNASHAEHQFEHWYLNAHNLLWRKRVEAITIKITHSPCGQCVHDLVNVAKFTPSAKAQHNLYLTWDELHTGINKTTSNDVQLLKAAKWQVGDSKTPIGGDNKTPETKDTQKTQTVRVRKGPR